MLFDAQILALQLQLLNTTFVLFVTAAPNQLQANAIHFVSYKVFISIETIHNFGKSFQLYTMTLHMSHANIISRS
jgi:hypothetical protein